MVLVQFYPPPTTRVLKSITYGFSTCSGVILETSDQSGSGRIHFPILLPWSRLRSFTKVVRMTRSWRWSVTRFGIELRSDWFLFLNFLFLYFLSTSQPLLGNTNVEQLSPIYLSGWTVRSDWFDPKIVRSFTSFNNPEEIGFVFVLNLITTPRMIPE